MIIIPFYACSLQNTSKGNQVTKVSVRRGRPGSKHAFSNWLTKVNWLELYQTEQCEEKLNIFQNILSGLDCFLPRKIVKVHVKDKPWITSKYKDIIAKRQRAFYQGDHHLYRKLRNRVTKEGNKLKANFLKLKLDELKSGKNKKWWDTVKQLAPHPKKKSPTTIVVNNQIIIGEKLAGIINDAFVSVTQHLDPLIDSSNDVQTTNNYDDDFLEFFVSEIEIYHKLSSISTSKSPGPADRTILFPTRCPSLMQWCLLYQ